MAAQKMAVLARLAAGAARGAAPAGGSAAAMIGAELYHAARALSAQRLRTLLALLGIVLSTSSLVLLVALLDGGRGALLEAEQVTQAERILAILRVLLFGATAISLLVSGINVMNVMLASVSERTVEIGIRRAVGTPPRAIRAQLAFEALLLTGAGGLLGVSLGAALAALVSFVLRRLLGSWELCIQPWAVLGGIAVSVLIGLAFGSYPARRAARLDIVRALRNE